MSFLWDHNYFRLKGNEIVSTKFNKCFSVAFHRFESQKIMLLRPLLILNLCQQLKKFSKVPRRQIPIRYKSNIIIFLTLGFNYSHFGIWTKEGFRPNEITLLKNETDYKTYLPKNPCCISGRVMSVYPELHAWIGFIKTTKPTTIAAFITML